jgi:hypothetical protein
MFYMQFANNILIIFIVNKDEVFFSLKKLKMLLKITIEKLNILGKKTQVMHFRKSMISS